MKKRGQSGVITIVLIILITMVAIIIVWNVIRGIIKEKSEDIDTSALTVNMEIDKQSSVLGDSSKIVVERNAGKGNITALKFVFKNMSGDSYVHEEETSIGELETAVFDNIDVGAHISGVSYVEIYPVFKTASGKEKIGIMQDSMGESEAGGTIIPKTYIFYKDVDGDDYSDGTTQVAENAPMNYYLASDLNDPTNLNNIDCDDGNAGINPGIIETPNNGVDENCDGGANINACSETAPLSVAGATYFLDNDISGIAPSCFIIGADNIILDMKGHSIRGIIVGYGISMSSHNGVTLKNGKISNFMSGIRLINSNNNVIMNMTLESNFASPGAGIKLESSNYNQLIYNTANSNQLFGIHLYSSSNNNLTNNTANANNGVGTGIVSAGIYLDTGSSNNELINNTASSNQHHGIVLYSNSNSNTLINNIANSNSVYQGIYIYDSLSNTIKDNRACINGNKDLYCYESSFGSSNGNTGSGNILSKVPSACSDGWPRPTDYSIGC